MRLDQVQALFPRQKVLVAGCDLYCVGHLGFSYYWFNRSWSVTDDVAELREKGPTAAEALAALNALKKEALPDIIAGKVADVATLEREIRQLRAELAALEDLPPVPGQQWPATTEELAALRAWFCPQDDYVRVYTPAEWAARGEQWGEKAVCVVVHDGGPFSRYGSGVAWAEFDKTFPALWQEQLTGWATALYRRTP